MFNEIHPTLRGLFHAYGGMPAADVDVSFETPTSAWITSLSKATLNCFLYDISENCDLRRASPPVDRLSHAALRRAPVRRFDLKVMVSAIAGRIEDEHLLIGRVLATILRNPAVPAPLAPSFSKACDVDVLIRVAEGDAVPRSIDIWNTVGGPPRPSILTVVTVPVDLDWVVDKMPLVLTRTFNIYDTVGNLLGETFEIGGTVRTQNGDAVEDASIWESRTNSEIAETDDKGRFSFRWSKRETIDVRVLMNDRELGRCELTIPSNSYDIIL